MKRISELSIDELKMVFAKNSKLEEDVFNDMFENADFWNGEYLDSWQWGGIDYSIGWDRGTYFKCTDYDNFLAGLEYAQNCYGFLADKYKSIIDYTNHLVRRLKNLYVYSNYYDENYERLENRIDELIEELEHACYKRFMEEYEYCFGYDNQLDYFINCYSDNMTDDYYVDDEYNLFEHVEYVKSYS